MTPYEEGERIARERLTPPPFPKGDASWADRLRNRGFLDARAALAKHRGSGDHD